MEPWTPPTSTPNVPNRKPSVFSDEELEVELFKLFLRNRFQPGFTVGVAADSWLAMMDRLLTLGTDCSEEIARMKENIYRLIDIYYDALDAPKKGGRREIFEEARALYQVTCNHAKSHGAVGNCSFAWRVSGLALCTLYVLRNQGERPIICSPSALKGIL
ncbi:RNA-dependent RNA polymerase [Salix purpurea]|uniref:RNA-dependent RNA polymerase n=1 Tax=Salix purpurea TaxID=77065 RepID=A0A9Q0Q353_SALPP|nr:RNA-dependent RNA polymerase [Salix purpurea]